MQTTSALAKAYLTRLRCRARGELNHTSSGFDDLDKFLPGWLSEGNLVVIAGRPAMGKSIFGEQISENVAKTGKTVMIFTLEMSSDELMERAIARRSGVPIPHLKTGQVKEFRPVVEAAAEVAGLPVLIDDTEFELERLIAKARRMAAELETAGLPPLGLIVVDYLQLVVAHGANRSLEIGAISAALKRLAKELKTPVVALSQVNRALENRTDKRPVLSDLRESGNIEQDADLVLFLYRDEYYDENSPDKGIAEVIARKNRHGRIGTVKLAFVSDRVMFAGRV